MKIIWSDGARASFHRHLHDQEGLHAVAQAVIALADNPTPPEAFRWGNEGDYRLRVGPYRVMYRVTEDVIFIGRVDRLRE
jgi:mRNA-degrading endonuclease RelE of RelBE toxin-antitoxin system